MDAVDNLADFFIKCLPPATLYAIRDAIMNVPAIEKPSLASGGGRCLGESA